MGKKEAVVIKPKVATPKPDAETLQKRAIRQDERSQLTSSQQAMSNSAYAQRTAQEKAAADQQAAQNYKPTTLVNTNTGINYGVSQGTKIAQQENIQGFTDQYNYDMQQARQEIVGTISGEVKVAKKEYIENPVKGSPIHARTSAGGIKKQDPFAKTPTATDVFAQQEKKPTDSVFATQSASYIDPTRADPSMNLTGKVQDNTYVNPLSVEPAVPFGALSVDERGLPYYGDGLKGWARKTWADLADPKKYQADIYKLTPDEQRKINSDYAQNVANSTAALSKTKWMGTFEKWFGLSARDVATFTNDFKMETAIAAATDQSTAGTTAARVTRVGVDTVQNLIWGGLDLLGMDDTAVRKFTAGRVGIDAVADKYNKDEENFVDKLQSTAVGNAAFYVIGGPLAAAYQGYQSAKDFLTIAKEGDLKEVNPLDKTSTISEYMAGSKMAYSMLYDNIAKEQFAIGLAEGKDPGLLAQNYGNVGIELAGSILGSPSTYLGLGIAKPINVFEKTATEAGDVIPFVDEVIKLANGTFGTSIPIQRLPWKTVTKIPTFGEIMGLGIGKSRMAAEAARFSGTSSNFAPVVEMLQDAQKLEGPEAAALLDEAVKATATVFDNQRIRKGSRWWNLAAFDSNGKISVASRDADLFIGSLTGSEGVQGTLEIMRDMVAARRGGDQAVEAAARLMNRADTGVFSEVGDMVGEVMSRLDEADMLGIVKKYSGSTDPTALHAALTGELEKILEEFIPSVDDMLKAEKLFVNGDKSARTVQLAEMAKDIPEPVRLINKVTQVPKKISQMTTGAMVQSYMAWMPRATAKNIEGQILPMAFHIGLGDALSATLDSVLSLGNQSVLNKVADVVGQVNETAGNVIRNTSAESILARKASTIEKLFGFIPSTKGAGIQKVTDEFKGVFKEGLKLFENQLAKSGRAEVMADMMIKESVGKREILAALPAVIKGLPEYDAFVKALPDKAQASLFTNLLDKNYGVWDDAVEEFRKMTSTGVIEAWRVTPISSQMRKHLEYTGMIDAFTDLQRNASDPQQIDDFLKQFETLYRKNVTDEALKLPSTMQMPPPGQEKLFTSIELHPNEANNMIRELYLSAQNMRNQLNEVVSQANQSFIDQLGKIPDEAARLEASQKYQATVQKIAQVQKEVGAPQARLNNILENVNEWYKEVKSGPSQMRLSELWNKNVIYGTEEGFQLSKIYPDVDVNTLTPEVFADLMWKAQRNEAADKWMHYNTKLFDGTMGSLSDMSKEFGTSLDDIVMADKSGSNPYRVLNDYYKKYAEIEEQYSWQRYLDQFTAAPDTKLSAIGGDKGKMLQEDYITRIVNTTEAAKTSKSKANPLVYLKDNGGIAPTDFKDIFGESTAQGVLPGLLKKDARAIDDVGVRLWEGGFITKEQADDYEYIRDFLRGFQKGTVSTDAQIAAKEANYFLDQAGMSVIPYEEITIQQARDALRNTKRVYSYDGGPLNEARVMYEGMDNFLNDTQLWGQKIKDEWGKTVKSSLLSSEAEAQMQKAKTAFEQRMKVVRRSAAVTAQSTRNFVLHSYDKTYLDHALSYLLGNSLHYWSTRSYARTIETLVDNPKIANTYLAYREYMTKKHADMPEWYRYNIDVGSLMGIDSNNQYFINLEQAVNPIMGLTGVDFDDPYKRVDWMSRMVADSGKLGVSFSPLVNWAIALKANEQGNTEAAQRWAGRLLPQSQYIKSVTSGLDNILEKFGVNGVDTKPLEVDPFVLMFTEGKTLQERMMNGVDPYERNKVVASLATMVQAGEITEEQMIEAAKAKSGDIWQAAIEKAADKRYTGDIQSFFLGSGMKPRTQDDMVIEKFWGDYSVLQASRSQMTPEQYRVAFTNMHDNPEYGKFVDGLLLSRKSGSAMDSAYTYNVLGRIPPGQMTDIAKVVGLNPDQIALFYEMKGDFTKMGLSTSDLANFNAGIADIAAMVSMPSTATKQQWNQVSTLYSAMRDAMTQEFGSDIYDRIGAYYDLQSTADKNKFLENNPDVEAAMAKETGYKANTPLLMQYYGGMSTLERYYSNQVSQTLKDKYAPAIIDDAGKLYDKNTSPEQRDAILRQYSPLRQYQYEYGNADNQAAQQLQSKWGDMSEALSLYNSEQAIRDYAYRKEIDKKYHVSQYNRELSTLTKTLRKEINTQYGDEIVKDAKVYGQISDADRKNELESKYSDLEKYLNEKSSLYDENFQAIVDFGNYLPEGVTPEPRPESTPANGDQQQQDLYNLMNNPVPERTFEDWTGEIGTPTAELIQDAVTSDSVMPYEVTKRLGYEAERLGYRNADALLQAILLSMQN